MFSEFHERAFAAASIGQVHPAVTVDGEEVAVKFSTPGSRRRSKRICATRCCCCLWSSASPRGWNARARAAEMRERIGEELDYELEAQSQRRIERLTRGHPFIRVPRIRTDLLTRRVLVSEYVEGERF
jgi:predicted unusual protein kinase regulating ubiquinone biosynthesis (AarF/ABC1/UbiB family)